ncbi:MAG: glycogen/starch synthase, partial [Candidatus Hydrothermarchaeota archaeon]|nr:glycogen/starch synthase [Candidatus Hydrothermarchaeota archaeon]
METLRIAFFCWESVHSVRTGGLAPAATGLAEALARRGNEVHFFTRRGEGQAEREEINDVHYWRCHFYPGHNIMQYAENMGRAMFSAFCAAERSEGRFDIVHTHDWHVAQAVHELKNRCPVVLTYHSTEYGRNGNKFGGWWEFKEISVKE